MNKMLSFLNTAVYNGMSYGRHYLSVSGQLVLPSRMTLDRMFSGVVVYCSFLEAKALMVRLCQMYKDMYSPLFWIILITLTYAMVLINFKLINYMWKAMFGPKRNPRRHHRNLMSELFDARTTRSGRVYGKM